MDIIRLLTKRGASFAGHALVFSRFAGPSFYKRYQVKYDALQKFNQLFFFLFFFFWYDGATSIIAAHGIYAAPH